MLSGILANLPMVLPSSVSFQRYHLRHHAYQGVYEMDADLPSRWEARLVGRSPLAKGIWLALFPALMITRAIRLKEVRIIDRWLLLNLALVTAFDGLVFWLWGAKALAYLFASFVFSVGLHPLGARWIQEHYLVSSPQETYSYYGRLNTVAFNVGYHNEHHDFPSVPWNRLPRLRAMAAAWYDSLVSHTSWTLLLVRFLFDRRLLLFSRMTRTQRAGVAMPYTDYQPDLEIAPAENVRPETARTLPATAQAE
jgi:sphingolipid delta-4 desaturase